MNEKYKKELVARYANNQASEKELQVFFGMLSTEELDAVVEANMDQEILAIAETQYIEEKRKVKLWPRIAVAAAVLLVAGMGVLFFNNYINKPAAYTSDVAPGKNTATLTLANGKTISLSDAKSGIVINAANSSAAITYNDGSKVRVSSNEHPVVNSRLLTATTPRGGQYTITLPDGTKVWLNAESSIKFPSTFSGLPNRTVELFGEAYFEVSKVYKSPLRGRTTKQPPLVRIPFFVKTDKQQVEVLGTHFNINSYADETATTTTLLEGSVKVSSLQGSATLKPGQQSTLANGALKVTPADIEETIAWKNGFFLFKDDDLQTVMRQIARWYNIEVIYEGNIPKRSFDGKIYRKLNLSKALEVLRYADINFRIENRKIIITP